jgi:glycosyltransferase involved in cell wall biosynthesis
MRIAIVHDWLDGYRGGERVLEVIANMFPKAPIYTLFYESSKLPKELATRKVYYPKGIAFLKKMRRFLLPFLPSIIESFDLQKFDLIISTSSCVAKGVIPAPDAKHICYIHSPMRYIWDQSEIYKPSIIKKLHLSPIYNLVLNYLRLWDVASSARVDKFIANSTYVGLRVKKFYRRDSSVIHPPVDTKKISGILDSNPQKLENYYIIAGCFVPYKNFDLAIKTFVKNKKKLIVVGDGPQRKYLKSLAKDNIVFVTHPPYEKLIKLISAAKAFIFPGIEDFGIIAIESMACGTPVLALQKGGALDFVDPGKNGMFFKDATQSSLQDCLDRFGRLKFDREKIKIFSENFCQDRFIKEFKQQILNVLGAESEI